MAQIIVVLINGRPTTFGPLNAVLGNVDAMLVTGRPGQAAGDGIADILYGKVAPSGKLTTSWPRIVGHVGLGRASVECCSDCSAT